MKRKLNEHDVPEASEPTAVHIAKDATPAVSTFAALDLDSRLLQAVSREKLSMPTAVQSKTIPLVLGGKNALVRAKTGSGKTLAYVLPVLHSILRQKSTLTSSKGRTRQTDTLILVPTKELAAQVSSTLKAYTAFCGSEVRSENLSRKEDDTVTRARLTERPDIVVSTPSRAALWAEKGALELQHVRFLVLDEADLVLSYGYEDDLRSLSEALPTGVQTLMMSATLRTEVDTLTQLFCKTAAPEVVDLSREEAEERPTLAHYTVRTAEEDKFLLVYAIFKLQLIKGKVIVFVAEVDRAYRVKLFLEKFGIRACVLNSELPVNSRLHAVEEFNRGVYDILIAADETDVVGDESRPRKRSKIAEDDAEGEAADAEDAGEESQTQPSQKRKSAAKDKRQEDPEYGVARGIDFKAVTCVLNFDLPTSSKSYTHRVGRTARAGKTGMALSFYVPQELYRRHKPTSIPQCKDDEDVLRRIRKKVEGGSGATKPDAAAEVAQPSVPAHQATQLQEWAVDWQKLEGLRYRFADALRSVTRIAVREARTRELRQELINSEKLKRHFEENPDDLKHLRHDREVRVGRQMPHLKHVPGYLLPNGAQAALGKEVGFVGLHKSKENRIRKSRQFKKSRGKLKVSKGKGLDPLRSLSVKGKGKK